MPGWPQFRNGPRHTGTNPSEDILSPTDVGSLGVKWRAILGDNGSSPAVADRVVYVGSDDDKLYAFKVGCGVDGSTGSPLWTATTGGE